MQAVIDKINNSKSVAIITHINEDPDTLGSCFAFQKMMRKMGKKATVYVSGKIEGRLAFMGSDYVTYKAGITHDHDLCACIDCADLERIGERRAMFEEIENTINIDHHFTNDRFADANYVDGQASAAGEIVAILFKMMNLELDDDIAKDLYTAICSDTGSFKYSSVTPKTMRIAADLLEYDFDHAEISRLLFDTEVLSSALFEAEVTGNIQRCADGKITFVTVDEKDGEKYGIQPEDIPNLVEIPRRIEGTEIAVCIKKTRDAFRVNLRSNGDADVAKVAASFGGGGHVKAAGCTIKTGTLEEAAKSVIAMCKKAIEEM